jgi:hypothetical protein
MLTLSQSPAPRQSTRTVNDSRREPVELVPAERVKMLLHEAAIRLHTTRVVGWKNGAIAPKKG